MLFFNKQTQTAVSWVIETVIVGVNLNCDLTPKNDAKVQIFFFSLYANLKKDFAVNNIFIQNTIGSNEI